MSEAFQERDQTCEYDQRAFECYLASLPQDISAVPDATYLTLARVVENQIIPRLLCAHKRADDNQTVVTDAAIVVFTDIVMHRDVEHAYAYIAKLISAGAPLATIYLSVLAPAAVRLGQLWDSDEASFFDVTLAMCKLHRMAREFSRQHGDEVEHVLGHRVMLAAVPGNQHLLGVAMVEELFRQSGWNVCNLPASNLDDIVATARSEWFAVIGLSASCDDCVDSIAPLIARLRASSMNRSVVVLVGGRYFNDNPEQALLMGADATASDAREAIIESKRYVEASKLTARC